MVFLITAEAMAVYLVWISVFSTRTDPDAPAQFNKTLINTFSVFGMAANAIKGIRRATIDPLDAKDKNTKTKKTKEQKSQRLR